jgi:prophage tail gpP-like protein
MPDKVELFVNKVKIEHFLKYSIAADLYTPADAFHLELANPETEIIAGKLCELKINDKLELTGIIDKVIRKVKKGEVSLAVEGRDYMGLLLDSYCEPPWKTVTGMKLKALADLLLAKTPFITRKTIVYQDNVVGKLKGKKKAASSGYLSALDTAQKIGQIEPGMTIFDVLKNYSLSRGMLFYCLPDGTLVFGRPLAKGAAEYKLTLLKSGLGNNVIESEVEQDISKRYKKYSVVGQQQGSQGYLEAKQINTSNNGKPCIDPEFPFDKPFVTTDNNDNVSPTMRARMIMEKRRREGTHLVYTVGRHSQNGQNWAINKMCHIKDETQSLNGKKGIDKDYLIYGRTFEMDKQTGPITKVKLGVPGIVA